MSKEIVNIRSNAPADLIREAMSGGADLDKLEKLLVLQERWEANEARKAYNVAMSDFKSVPIKVIKDSQVKFDSQKGRTEYKYANLANVVDCIATELSKHGLSASWRTSQTDKITVTCRISHILGHYEETSLTAMPDSSGNKNFIQSVGSTVTYLERYTILAMLGLATYDQDDDGRSVENVKSGNTVAPKDPVENAYTRPIVAKEKEKENFKESEKTTEEDLITEQQGTSLLMLLAKNLYTKQDLKEYIFFEFQIEKLSEIKNKHLLKIKEYFKNKKVEEAK